MCHDVGGDTCLSDESVKRQKIGVFRLPQLRRHNGVTRVNSWSTVGVNRVARVESSLFEIIFADECQNLIVEVKAIAGESRDRFGEFGGVGVLRVGGGRRRSLLLLMVAEGREWGFDTEATLALAAFGSRLFWGCEGEEAKGDGDGRRRRKSKTAGFS